MAAIKMVVPLYLMTVDARHLVICPLIAIKCLEQICAQKNKQRCMQEIRLKAIIQVVKKETCKTKLHSPEVIFDFPRFDARSSFFPTLIYWSNISARTLPFFLFLEEKCTALCHNPPHLVRG